MSVTSPALARQAPANKRQGLGSLQRTRRFSRAKRLQPTTASLRSPAIGAGRPKIGLQPLTTTRC